jgi:hypothetical protein
VQRAEAASPDEETEEPEPGPSAQTYAIQRADESDELDKDD